MALMQVDFYSEVLDLCVQADVILPQRNQGVGLEGAVRQGPHPVLWLLHGGSDDHTIWQRRTSIERYVAPLGLAVVMPAVQLSMYANMAHGGAYQDFISAELPEIMRSFFPLSAKREDNFLAGLSMGGYGALRTGLAHPERYSAIGCLSCGNMPVLAHTLYGNEEVAAKIEKNQSLAFGERRAGSENDLYHLARQAVRSGAPLPRIYQACGSSDFTLAMSRDCRDFFTEMAGNPFDYTYKEGPGSHDWDFWDLWIQDYLKWLKNGSLS